MFRVLTVAREYGSGGGLIARRVAEKLGWNLLDKALVEAIARSAQVDPDLARRYDERVDSTRGCTASAAEAFGAERSKELPRSPTPRSSMQRPWRRSGKA